MIKHGAILKTLWVVSDTGCWDWIGSINKKTGYGKKQLSGKTLLAHRWMYEVKVGRIPEGLVVNHKCRNRACVNPDHLEVVTQAENCRHGLGTKLSPEKVKLIQLAKKDRKWGDATRLAEKYKVSSSLIKDIWAGRAWKNQLDRYETV